MTTVPRWQLIADSLERQASGPSTEQLSAAKSLGVDLPVSLPAPVAAVVLRHRLCTELRLAFRSADGIPAVLRAIEDELGVSRTESLLTDTSEEVSAWFESRYILKTVRGLRNLKPEVGDVVSCAGWREGERRVISTIQDSGRIFMKLKPVRSAWPNHLEMVARVGSPQYEAAVKSAGDSVLNSTVSTSTNLDNFVLLSQYELKSHIPTPEAIRALEELLESGERREEPLQVVLTQYPELLASTVVGGWKTFVIPKPRLGAEHVPDFLILGINSVGPQWLTVEIEGARHKILTKKGKLAQQTRHAIEQVEDWREWLTRNVSYTQIEKGYHGLTTRAPGLVIIGRDDPSAERQASRARTEEQARIAVHSWDWLLRGARNLSDHALYKTKFAVDNLNEQAGQQVVALPVSRASTFDELFAEDEDAEFNRLPW